MKYDKGFTLVELIASISLILILFVIVMPISTNMIQNSNKKQCKTLVEDILTNAELYVLDRPNFTETSISLNNLYNSGYLDDNYDFKNGYTLENGILKYEGIQNTTIQINIDSSNGYNKYELDICD